MPFHKGTVASGFLGVVPGTPGTPTATTCANAQSVLSWTAPVSNGGSALTDYVVQYSTNGTTGWTTFSDGTSVSTGTTVTGLSNGTTYYFRVAAVNTYGTGSYSGVSTVITPATVPDAPTSVQGTSNANGQSSVSWVAPSGAGTGGNGPPFTFTVQYSTSATFASAVTTFGTTSSSSPLIVNGLSNGTPYYFRVKATNCAGDSAYSSISTVATPATVPGAPTIGTMTLSTTNTTDSLAWTVPASDGGSAITGYVYTLSTDSYVAATPTGSTSVSRTFNPGYTTVSTTVKIAAVNAIGTGPFSAASAVGYGGWSNPSYVINDSTDCANCAACPCAACDGGCDGCGTRSITGSNQQTGTKGTKSKTCYKWTRGAQDNAGPFDAGTTTACTAVYGNCSNGDCGCAAGNPACDCSGCSATWGGDNFVSSFIYSGSTYTRFPVTNSAGNGTGTFYYYIDAANDINNLCGCYEHRAYTAQYCSAGDTYRAIDTGGCQYYRSLDSCGGGGGGGGK